MAADVAELIVALKLRDGLSSGLGNLNHQLRGMQGGLSDVGRGIGQVGAGLGRIATQGAIAAAAGLGAVVAAAVSFEDAFAGVRKTVDASESEFGQLEERLREMARSMPVSFQELAGIAEAGGALGIAFEGLDEFTQVVADLAATTDLSADQAATSLGVLGNVLQLRAEDFDNFGSALVDLGNKGASTETQILAIAERIGATGNLIGLSSDQVLGFGAAVANVGIEAEAGGSALQRFFIDALTAVESGGEDLQTFARTAGVSAESFRDSFREDAGAALADFIEGLGELPDAVQIQTLADLGFNDVRITRTLLGLAGDADNLTDSLDIASKAFAANSALGVEAAKRYSTVASQLEILKNNVTDAAVVIGEQLLPVVGELTGELVAFINQPANQRALKEFGENLAGGIRDFATEIRKADFGPLLETLKGAAGIAKTAFDAFRSLPQPIQQLALAAIVANKVTGGAVGQIAGGLGGILKGVIQIGFGRGENPLRPLFVQQVGPGGTIGPTPGGGGGLFGNILKGLGVLFVAEFAVQSEGFFQTLADEVHEGLQLPDLPGPADWQWPLGSKNPPDWLPDFLGGPPPGVTPPAAPPPAPRLVAAPTVAGGGYDPLAPHRDTRPDPRGVFGLGALRDMIAKVQATQPPAMLPDTALRPVTNAITPLGTGIGTANARLSTTNAKLDLANLRLGIIANKPWGTPPPPAPLRVTTQVSSTVIQTRTAQQRSLSGTSPTPY